MISPPLVLAGIEEEAPVEEHRARPANSSRRGLGASGVATLALRGQSAPQNHPRPRNPDGGTRTSNRENPMAWRSESSPDRKKQDRYRAERRWHF